LRASLLRVRVLLLLSLLMGCAQAVDVTPAMQQAADQYLTLLDRGEYAQVWQQAAHIFQAGVGPTDWQARMQAVHKVLGKAQSRALRSAVLKTDPANSPPGEYLMMTFDSAFTDGAKVETLVLYAQQGNWRMAGYFIK